jgi:iron complex transport system substrate-binding protein
LVALSMWAGLAWLALLVGCRGSDVAKSESSAAGVARVVSLAPSLTELSFALGAGEQLVGATRYCDYPPEVAGLPRVGGVVDPSFEAIVALQPSLVLAMEAASSAPLFDRLRRAGIPVRTLRMDTLAETFAGVEALGEALGRRERGVAVRAELEAGLAALRSAAGVQSRAVVVYGQRPLVVAGPGTFANELLELVGFRNAAGEASSQYPTWSIEELVRVAPEVIFDASMDADAEQMWEKWQVLPAVANKRVFRVNPDLLSRPGPRLVLGAAQMAELASQRQ